MRLGILSAISPETTQVNWNGTPIDAYIRFFQSVDPPFDYVGYEVTQGQFPDSPAECHAYVVTGSPRGVYDTDEWIATLVQFIRDSYQAGITRGNGSFYGINVQPTHNIDGIIFNFTISFMSTWKRIWWDIGNPYTHTGRS